MKPSWAVEEERDAVEEINRYASNPTEAEQKKWMSGPCIHIRSLDRIRIVDSGLYLTTQ